MIPRREILISLRARRHAYRIASRFLRPRIAHPQAPLAIDAPPPHDEPAEFRLDDDGDIGTVLLAISALIGFVCVILFLG